MVSDYVMGSLEVMTKPTMLLANIFDDQDGNLILKVHSPMTAALALRQNLNDKS
jgi:hypothetical protein